MLSFRIHLVYNKETIGKSGINVDKVYFLDVLGYKKGKNQQ